MVAPDARRVCRRSAESRAREPDAVAAFIDASTPPGHGAYVGKYVDYLSKKVDVETGLRFRPTTNFSPAKRSIGVFGFADSTLIKARTRAA